MRPGLNNSQSFRFSSPESKRGNLLTPLGSSFCGKWTFWPVQNTATRNGKGCDWLDVILGLRVNF